MSLFHRALVRVVSVAPRALVRRVASRYVAGETLADAVRVVGALNREGCLATMDVLGEDSSAPEESDRSVAAYRDALDAIALERLQANVSVKLTALGLKQDPVACRRRFARIVESARAHDNFVRIDMEDSSVTEETIRVFLECHARLEPVGLVLQAYLRRTAEDSRRVADVRANVRVCKGIYVEPPEIAFPTPREIRDSYTATVDRLLEAGCHIGIATHDPQLVERALATIARLRLAPDRYEFQMLLGVAASLRRRLVSEGHRLRVYVPYGRAWYAYSVRRLKENPAIAGQVLRGLLKGGR